MLCKKQSAIILINNKQTKLLLQVDSGSTPALTLP